MSSSMAGRERVNRMFQRRDHQRVARQDTYWTETIQGWPSKGLDGDVERLGDTAPCPFPGRRGIVQEDERGYCDHRVPPDVPVQHYLSYLSAVRQVWGKGENLKSIKALANPSLEV